MMMKQKNSKTHNHKGYIKAVTLLLIISLALVMAPEVTAKKKTSGTFYGTKWSFNTKTKTLTLSCKGIMDDEYSKVYGGYWPWKVWQYDIKNLVVKEGVTYLGSGVVDSCSNVRSVSLPKSLKKVGSLAFWETGLTKITLPSNLKGIKDYAFSSTKLKEIVIPQKTTEIGGHVFDDCKKLTKVKLPKKLKKISEGLFCYCSKLKTITLPKNITKIGESAFYESGLTSITIPKKVTSIKAEAFKGCGSLKKVTFQTAKLTAIDASLFEGCKRLKSITLPNSVTTLKGKAFKESGLSSITIPERVTSLGEECFADCNNLKEIVFTGGQVTAIGANALKGVPSDCVIKVPSGQAERMKALLAAGGIDEAVSIIEQ